MMAFIFGAAAGFVSCMVVMFAAPIDEELASLPRGSSKDMFDRLGWAIVSRRETGANYADVEYELVEARNAVNDLLSSHRRGEVKIVRRIADAIEKLVLVSVATGNDLDAEFESREISDE